MQVMRYKALAEKLTKLKTALMQDLLTGDRRVSALLAQSEVSTT
jgi:hypothetical protein